MSLSLPDFRGFVRELRAIKERRDKWFAKLENPLAHMSDEDAAAYVRDLQEGGGAYAYVSKDGSVRRIDPSNVYSEPPKDD